MIAAITILIAISGAALLLILFIRIRDAGKELRLDQHRSKAMGLMQLLLGTAQGVAKHNGIALSSNNQVFEPPTNIALGTAYLNYVLKRHNGNAMLAVASYNGGPNAAAKWMREFQVAGGGDQEYLVENIPFQETRDYVRKVFANYWTYENLYLKKQVN